MKLSLSLSPDGQQFASASADCPLRLWDPKPGAASQTLEGDTKSNVSSGQQAARLVRLRDPNTGAALQTLIVTFRREHLFFTRQPATCLYTYG